MNIKLWDTTTGQQRAFLVHPGGVRSVAYSPNGETLASAGWDKTVRLWDVTTGKQQVALPHSDALRSLAFSPDGKTLASGSEDGTVKLWNTATWREEITLHGHAGPVICLSFSPDGKTLASASAWGEDHGVLNLWDMSPKPARSRHRLAGASTMAFAPNGKTLATAHDGSFKLWDIATGQQRAASHGPKAGITALAFSPDERYVAAGGVDRTLWLWEVASGEERSQSGASRRDSIRRVLPGRKDLGFGQRRRDRQSRGHRGD